LVVWPFYSYVHAWKLLTSPVQSSLYRTATPSKLCTTSTTERVHLYRIDCLEKAQAFGQKATHATPLCQYEWDTVPLFN